MHPGGGGSRDGGDFDVANLRDLFSDAIAGLGQLLALPWVLPLAAVLSAGTLLALALSEATRRRHPTNAWAAFGGTAGGAARQQTSSWAYASGPACDSVAVFLLLRRCKLIVAHLRDRIY